MTTGCRRSPVHGKQKTPWVMTMAPMVDLFADPADTSIPRANVAVFKVTAG